MTRREIHELRYFAKSRYPLFGGHLERGEPLPDPQLARWLEMGLIKQVGNKGYEITPAGRAALTEETGGGE
jgi:hypothetical protein